ncbi:MAG: FHA domain-containing protein [Candidatus Binatia bacterium]
MTYGWWNLGVLLFATVGLLVLSRVRLSIVPVEMTGVALPTPMGAVQSVPYARLVRRGTVLQEIPFVHDDTLIGSGPECDVILRHPSIARQHARVQWRKQGYILCAEQGKQRTFVNGRPVTENLLKDGWTVRLGEVEFVFYGART